MILGAGFEKEETTVIQQLPTHFRFVWRQFHTILLLTAFMQWALVHPGSNGVVNAAPSLKTPGEMQPKSLSLLVGDNATIVCRLSKANSKQIWFYEEKSRRIIKQPSDYIKVLDAFSAALTIPKANEQKSLYQCRIENYAIDVTELYVGTKPLNVTDFSCKVYDYEYMECYFSKSKNMLLTHYDLDFDVIEERNISVGQMSYSVRNYSPCLLDDSKMDNRIYCNITDAYYPIRHYYIFRLTASNVMGVNVQYFIIENHKIVIPADLDIKVTNTTSKTVTLIWHKPNIGYYYPKYLIYDIRLNDDGDGVDDGSNSWFIPQYKPPSNLGNGTFSVTISELQAYWRYKLRIRVKSKAVDQSIAATDDMWSKASELSFHTMPCPPHLSPLTAFGGFYIDNTETDLHLYWNEIDITQHNGPDFHYIINELSDSNVVISSKHTNETSTVLPWHSNHMRRYCIKSANAFGESVRCSFIDVYPLNSMLGFGKQFAIEEKSIEKVYHNNSYTLSWQPPQNTLQLLNYTIFWCSSKVELPNQCKGPIQFRYLHRSAKNFTTQPTYRSLNLAVSANYLNYSSGMKWAKCSGDAYSELMKMEIEVMSINSTAILVRWNSGNVCATILKGYMIEIETDSMKNNHSKTELPSDHNEYRNYTINAFQPYTKVCVNMSMYSYVRSGRSSDIKCVRTLADAPSPPHHLNFIANSVTSNSVNITWQRPEILNGELSNYTIYWRKSYDESPNKKIVSSNQTSYILRDLNSFTSYIIYVTAHTIKESSNSNEINVTTLIGIPSQPRFVDISADNRVISWSAPSFPSGRLEFYIVALIRRSSDGVDITEATAITKATSCTFEIPECYSNYYSYTLKVQAVNVATAKEYDYKIKQPIYTANNFTLNINQIDRDFCKSNDRQMTTAIDNIIKNLYIGGIKYYLSSPWSYSHQVYKCSGTPFFAYIIAVIMLGVIVGCIAYWLRNKYREMKNIQVILPQGLIDQLSKSKYTNNNVLVTSNTNEKLSYKNIMQDYFTNVVEKQNDNYKTYLMNDVNITVNHVPLKDNNRTEGVQNENCRQESIISDMTNEEFLTNSSTTSVDGVYKCKEEDAGLTTVEGTHNDKFKDVYEDIELATPGSYVTPTKLLLSTNFAANNENLLGTQSALAFLTSDYVSVNSLKQLQLPPKPINTSAKQTNGYSSINEINNVCNNTITSPGTKTTEVSSSKTHNSSMPSNNQLLLLQKEFPDTICSDGEENSTTSLYCRSAMNNILDNNEKNISGSGSDKSIFGYVTQKQLANFGTNVVLDQEVRM